MNKNNSNFFCEKCDKIFFLKKNIFFEDLFEDIYLFNAINSYKKVHMRMPDISMKNFSDVIFFRKLDFWKKDMQLYVDKLLVRDYVKNNLNSKYLSNIQNIYKDAKEIDINKLIFPCVLKSNHACGHIQFLNKKDDINIELANKWLSIRYGINGGENQYRDINPFLYIEDKLSDNTDYKFHCFGGKVLCIQVDTNRFKAHKQNFYDINWNSLDFCIFSSLDDQLVKKPHNLDEMIYVAEKLSAIFKYIRVDLYSTEERVIFGELTLTPLNTCCYFTSKYWENIFIELYKKNENNYELI